jgi:membrane protease YdiL (CAAX protease family)
LVLLLGVELARLRWREIGFDRVCLRRGLWWGGLGFAIEAIALVALAVVPQTRDLFDDRRVREHLDGAGLVDQVVWQIPLGTVLLEEVAFRGVLLALLLRRLSPGWSVAASSTLFGLWHILPSAGVTTFNPIFADVADNPVGRASAVFVAIGATAGVGALLCWLRLRAGHLIAPIIVHAGGNVLAFSIAWMLLQPR